MWRQIASTVCTSGLLLAADADFFETRVRPVLAKNCYSCHTGSRLGGLQLDSGEGILKGGNSGPAIVPGDPEKSLLIQAVLRVHEKFKMPPQGPLEPAEVAGLRTWIQSGAVWPAASGPPVPASTGEYLIRPEQRAFWAFQPVKKLPSPAVKNAMWPRNNIDRFILAALEQRGLSPVAQAGKRDLLRRATFDLTGLPASPEEVDAFIGDSSSGAFAKVVDRLLASPHYGERWGRYWLDLARYSDGDLGASKDTPYANAFRYRDWVINAFNTDLPYDVFVKAQIAADLMGPKDAKQTPSHLAALGFHALGHGPDDQVDVSTRVFLGLTVGCAKCHDHKYDPIPTRDYYSLRGIFKSSEVREYPLAPEAEVSAYKAIQKQIEEKKFEIDDFVKKHGDEVSDVLATKTASYLLAAWNGTLAESAGLDAETLERWQSYLKDPRKEHPYLKPWFDLMDRRARGENVPLDQVRKTAADFQSFVLAMNAEKKGMDDRNYVAMGGAKGVRDERTRQYTNLESLEIVKYYLWRDLASDPYKKDFVDFKGGVYHYGAKQIDRFLPPLLREHLTSLRTERERVEKSLPKQYAFMHAVRDSAKPGNVKVEIRGEPANPGEEAPRRFLAILSQGEPPPFTQGSGRLELAEAIASAANPLTARVMANRIWQLHFGDGIVRTTANFGQIGDRPSHPELLDYLATRFVESGWSVKALHREIMLSSTYQLSTRHSEKNYAADAANRYLWRANLRPRLDAEALRDSLLAVAGTLDRTVGGAPVPFDDANRRRSVYGLVSRTTPDETLALFDFPNPNNTSEQRSVTAGPMQRLFFLNSSFVTKQSRLLAERLRGDDRSRIREAYRLLYARTPLEPEVQYGLEFLQRSGGSWAQYAQALLSSSEFSSVN